MSAAEQTVELVETTEIEMFLPVMKEIDFGDRFLLSILHWCGIGRRSTALAYWKVFLLKAEGNVAGVSGLYRQPGMAKTVLWVGWFGIRPRFRRQGFGKRAMYALIDFARHLAVEELWVYTGSSDSIAVNFYRSLGFEVLGAAANGMLLNILRGRWTSCMSPLRACWKRQASPLSIPAGATWRPVSASNSWRRLLADPFYSLIGFRRGISGFEKSLSAAGGPTPMDVRRSAKEK